MMNKNTSRKQTHAGVSDGCQKTSLLLLSLGLYRLPNDWWALPVVGGGRFPAPRSDCPDTHLLWQRLSGGGGVAWGPATTAAFQVCAALEKWLNTKGSVSLTWVITDPAFRLSRGCRAKVHKALGKVGQRDGSHRFWVPPLPEGVAFLSCGFPSVHWVCPRLSPLIEDSHAQRACHALASDWAGQEDWGRGGTLCDVPPCSFSDHLMLLIEPLRDAGLLEVSSSPVL